MNPLARFGAGSLTAILAAAGLLLPTASPASAAVAAPYPSKFGAWAKAPADVARLSGMLGHDLTSLRVYYDTPPTKWPTGTGLLGALPDNGTVSISFHHGTPTQVQAFLTGHPAGVQCYATYYHEPEYVFKTPTETAKFRADFASYAPAIRAAHCIPTLIVGNWLLHDKTRDWHDYYPKGSVDALGFDAYNLVAPKNLYPDPTDFIAPFIAASQETGLPWAMPEVGSFIRPGGLTSATRASWAHQVAVAAYRDPGFRFADWWDSMGATPDYDFEIDAALAAAWTVDSAAPAPPTNVVATAGDGSAGLSWSAADDGGTPITGYTVSTVNVATGVTTSLALAGGSTAAMVPSLTNGQPYRFSVTATTRVGDSPPSTQSGAVTPTAAVVPGSPAIGAVTAGNSSAIVAWTPPADNGRSAVTGYTVSAADAISGAPAGTVTAGGNATTATVTGLTNGNSYLLWVFATNSVGDGSPSAPSAAVTPATVPSAPAISSVTAGDTVATATWTRPASGGSAITGYTITAISMATGRVVATAPAGANALSAMVGGLTNGKQYVLRVSASNAVGSGAPSAASATVIPRTVPDPPAIGIATAGVSTDRIVSASVTWTLPPSNGGSVVTGYLVTADHYSGVKLIDSTPWKPLLGGARSAKVIGLITGQTYRFRVQAINAAGTSPASASSNLVMAL